MKRRNAWCSIVFATIVATLGVQTDAAQVKLKPSTTARVSKTNSTDDAIATEQGIERSDSSPKKNDVRSAASTKTVGATKPTAKSTAKSTTNATSKSTTAPSETDEASVLIAPNSLRGKTKKSRESDAQAERPVVPEAMRMVLEDLAPTKRFQDARVLRAIARTPRADFAPKKLRAEAYRNVEVPLENGKRLESPLDVAYLLDAADLQSEDRVLIVDEGVGYVAAVASGIVSEVYAVGVDKKLARRAAAVLKSLKYGNMALKEGALETGWSAYAPYDKIVVAHGVDSIPDELVAQLKDGGKIAAPVGDDYRQILTVVEKRGDETTVVPLFPVMLDCFESNRDNKKAGEKRAELVVGGSFEEFDVFPTGVNEAPKDVETEGSASASVINVKRAIAPVGWRDAFNVEVLSSAAYDGVRACRFDNAPVYAEQLKKERNEARRLAATLPEDRRDKTLEYGDGIRENQRVNELKSTLRQNFPLDGGSVRKIIVSGAYNAERVEREASPNGVDVVRIVFWNKERKELGASTVLGVDSETTDWTEFQQEETVPAKTKEATIEIGVLSGVGTVWLDLIQVKSKFDR